MTAYRHGQQNNPLAVSLQSSSDKAIRSASETVQNNSFFPTSNSRQDFADMNALRHLLTAQRQRQQQLQQQHRQESASRETSTSASNFLRCFVHAVMQKTGEKGEHGRSSKSSISIYESLINGSKAESKSENNPDCPAKKSKIDDISEDKSENSRVPTETLASSENADKKNNMWDYPLDMSVSKCSVKQEPMELSVSTDCNSYRSDTPPDESPTFDSSVSGSLTSDRLSYVSPEEIHLESPGLESGVFDMSSSLKENDIEPASATQERKRTFESTLQSPVRKCNGSFAPRKMLIARSRRTHRSSSMESLSSLESTSYTGSLPPKTIAAVQNGDPGSDMEPSANTLPYPLQNNLALDMSTQCSLLLPIDSLTQNDSDSNSSRTASPTQGVVNTRELGGPTHTQCMYCNIQFGDEVLHSIHMGCHNHTEPFVCNMCGKDCENKYGFYTHIMRGHSS